MANKDLINLGISPDSGTGDSARRGGEKINNLFADVYSQFGDNPVGQDPSQPFYGYRRPFFEYEYKVGELHPAGRFVPIKFKTPVASLAYDSEWGWGHDNTGAIVDTDGDGIPDIYRDSEWYFLSRGEQIDADLSDVDSERKVHFVLPIAVPGDQITIRDGFSTWKKNIFINLWTSPYQFQSTAQVTEWQSNTGYTDGVGYPDSDTSAIFSPTDGTSYRSNWHKVSPNNTIQSAFERLSQPFALSRTTDPYFGLSPTYFQNITRYQIELLYTSYEEGWLIRLVVLDAADLSAVIDQLSTRLAGVDSDLDRGLYVSADSDIRHTVPLLRRTSDGREVHGTLSLRGDADAIMTTIDSEDTSLTNDPRSAFGGDTVQPLTTTIRFKLRDNVKVKDNLLVGGDVTLGKTFRVSSGDETHVTIDSDLALFNNRLQVSELATFDSDVNILGQLNVTESSIFNSDVRIEGNLQVTGDSTVIETESLRVRDNIITLSKDADGAPVTDTGLIFQRYDQTDDVNAPLTASDTLYNPFFVWNEASDKFKFGETVTSDSDLTLTMNRTYLEFGRGEFVLTDSEGTPRVVFEKATGWPDDVRGPGGLNNPNERPTVEPDYEFHVKSNVVLGRDSDDVVVFNSRIMSNLIPFGDEIYNLGDSDNKWNDLYLSGNTIYLGSIKLKDENGVLLIADSDDNRINLTGADFTTDNLYVDSELEVGGNTGLFGRLRVYEHAQFDSDVEIIGNLVVGDHVELGGHVTMKESLTVDSDVFLSADLYVDSDAVIKGQLTVGEQVRIDDTLYVADFAKFDSDVEIRGNLVVGDHVELGGHTHIKEGLTVDSDVVLSADVHIDSDLTVEGEVTVQDNVTVGGKLRVSENVYLDSDVSISGNLVVGDHSTLGGQVRMNEGLIVDSDVSIGGNLVVSDHVTLGGHTHILEGLVVDSDVFISSDLRVDSDVYIKGDVEIREDLVVIGELNVDDNVYFGHKLTVDSDVIFGSDLRVDSDIIIKGTMSVGQEAHFYDDVRFYDNALFDSDVFITGSLTVNGTTTYVNTSNLEVSDNFIVINKNQATPFNDTGIIFQRYDSDSVSAVNWNSILKWDETSDSFILGETSGSGITTNPSVTDKWISIGNAAASTAPFVFDDSGNSDPGGAPDGWAGGPRPTLTGDGTGVVDGGTF